MRLELAAFASTVNSVATARLLPTLPSKLQLPKLVQQGTPAI